MTPLDESNYVKDWARFETALEVCVEKYGIGFVNAVGEIRRACTCVTLSGIMNSLSFLFRGENSVRNVMHVALLMSGGPTGRDAR